MGEFQEKDVPATVEEVARHMELYKQQPYYKHFKGGWYRIDDIRNDDDGVLTAYYTSMHFQDESGAFTEHTREVHEFFGKVEKADYSGLRFWPHPDPIRREDNPKWVEAQKKAVA